MNYFATFFVCMCAVLNLEGIHGKSFPTYLTACHRNDPDLNECALRSAIRGAKDFARGDKKLGIPQLDPLKIKYLHGFGAPGSNGLNIEFHDATLSGLKNLNISKISIDLKKQKIILKTVADLVLEGNYAMTGRILVIPLNGKGHCKINLDHVKVKYSFEFDLVKKEDGLEYLSMKNINMKYEVGHADFKFDNLFNGDKLLGENTNNLLNESWKDVIAEVGDPVARTLNEALTKSVSKLFSQVPFEELLIP